MARCKSWRYTTVPQHQGHRPGKCRECWKPCTQTVETGVVRCHDCLIAILACPDTQTRRALLAEEGLTRESLELLADDANPMIGANARARLEAMRPAPGANSDVQDAHEEAPYV